MNHDVVSEGTELKPTRRGNIRSVLSGNPDRKEPRMSLDDLVNAFNKSSDTAIRLAKKNRRRSPKK